MPASENDITRAEEMEPESDPGGSQQRSRQNPPRHDTDGLDEAVLERTGTALAAQAAMARETSRLRRDMSTAQVAAARSLLARREELGSERRRLVMETARRMPSAPIDDRRARAIPHETSALILEEDPDLARGLPPVDRELLSELFQARVVPIAGRRWVPPAIDSANAFGLLLLDGVIGRRTRVAEAVATELLSTGDILRPWEQAGTSYPIEPEIDWRVLRPGRAAILDEGITRLIGGRPELLVAFSERLVRRAHNAGYLMALNHFSRVEDRLLATLWHLAATWGRVTPQGISIPFRLTHETLGEITGARRSTVTIAVGLLQDRGQLARGIDGRYVMTGDPENWRLPG